MFWTQQVKEQQVDYEEMLQILGSLSRLFSDSKKPYLGYRLVENLFCRSFDAENLSRSDVSADASKQQIGIGIKTFVNKNNNNLEKVAEFNKDYKNIAHLDVETKIRKIAELRNERINATKRIHGLDGMIYHCVLRSEGEIAVCEETMDTINLGQIRGIEVKSTTIKFHDNLHEYSFNLSKSTLYKRFKTDAPIVRVPVAIIADPFEALRQLLPGVETGIVRSTDKDFVVLPLYSEKAKGDVKSVPEKSGLNQWNAGGRKRDANEIYIPIPAWIHRKKDGFFPKRDQEFILRLPDGNQLSAKVCQDGDKALMSNPNKALGHWLLRMVLNLLEGELLTYKRLEDIGLDSVIIFKNGEGDYSIDFRQIGTYEQFRQEYMA